MIRITQEILVAVDGSKHPKVVERASKLAKTLSARVLLVYVAQSRDIPEEFEKFGKTEKVDLWELYKLVRESVLSKLRDKLGKENIPFEGHLDFGNPASKIVDIATSRGVAMIVVRMRGLHGVEHIRALGSIARKIIENSPCPVLDVPS